MARIRTVKPSMFSSLTVTSWPLEVRWTFVGLPTYMDDAGRALDEPRLVKAELWPMDDRITPKRVDEFLTAIAESGPLCRYKVSGQAYMHITSWREHQRVNRPSPSRIPPCPTHEKGGEPS